MLMAFTFRAKRGKESEFERVLNNPEGRRRRALLGPSRPLGRIRAPSAAAARGPDRRRRRVRRARGDSGRREGGHRPERHAARDRDPREDGTLAGGEGQGVLLPGAQLPSAWPVPLVPGGSQGRARGRDAGRRRLGGPRPEEGADPAIKARQGAGGLIRPLSLSFACFRRERRSMSSSNPDSLRRRTAAGFAAPGERRRAHYGERP